MAQKLCYGCMREIAEGESVCPVCGYRHGQEKTPENALLPGALLQNGRYTVGRVLGRGGFGITYIGRDLVLDLNVAIKEYFPSGQVMRNQDNTSLYWGSSVTDAQAGKDSFLKEAKKMARLDAIPYIVQVRDVFYENNTAYIVMGFVEGETLKNILTISGLMKPEDCITLLTPIMQSLNRAHSMGMIHRDISPDNIMIDHMGQPWLLDMGAAKDLEGSGKEHSMSSGTVIKRGFSPPEQYLDKKSLGSWTDVYAMTATIYYCITGKLVPEAMERFLDASVSYPDNIPERLREVLDQGLALRVQDRIRTMNELVTRLQNAVQPKESKADNKEAEEARKKAEEERKRKEDEAQAKAEEEEAEKKAAEEKKRREEAAAREKAEAEKKRKEEAREKAEEERKRKEEAEKKAAEEKKRKEAETPAKAENRQSIKQPEKKKSSGSEWVLALILIAVVAVGIYMFNNHGTAKTQTKPSPSPSVALSAITPGPSSAVPYGSFDHVGDIVTFGNYDQDNNTANGKEAIEWIVLDVQDGKSLLISRYALDCKQYNSQKTGVTWETCSLRKWLNSTFLTAAFSAEEQARIPTLTVSADKNPEYDTDPGKATEDQIFLLSIAEANKYFASGKARQCKPTAYAKAQGCYVNRFNGNCWWWLRSPGSHSFYAAYVVDGGSVRTGGMGVNNDNEAVRPALWINLDANGNPAAIDKEKTPSEPTTPTPTPEPNQEVTYGSFDHISDIVTFGNYEQDNDLTNGAEPIEWIVLDVQDGKSLLISRYALDFQPYNSENADVTWEICTLRVWLNSSFLTDAFSADEQAIIPLMAVCADKNPQFDTDPGSDTKDQIFLLSINEVNSYFASNEERQSIPTEYAIAKGCKVYGDAGACWWWLRTPGVFSHTAACVDYDGYAGKAVSSVNFSYPVRPALWVDLKAVGQAETLTACSSKKSAKLQIFSNLSQQEGYTNAAKKHFSNVSWTGSDSVSAGDLSDDTRYVVLIQDGEDVLSIEPIEGKRFTVLVYDKEGENIRITMRYCVGTTDNCVVKGNVVDGEMSFNRDMTLAETASADASKRAETIFNVIYQTIVDVEGE